MIMEQEGTTFFTTYINQNPREIREYFHKNTRWDLRVQSSVIPNVTILFVQSGFLNLNAK